MVPDATGSIVSFSPEHLNQLFDCELPMTKLVTTARFSNPDAAYGNLLAARRGLSEADAAAFDARLVLILANQIGDLDVLEEGTLARSAGQRG
jgi:hypothetical protein